MKRPLLCFSCLLAVFLSSGVVAQGPVPITFQTDPVLSQTGAEIIFTVLTDSRVFSMTWTYKGVDRLGTWSGGIPNVNPVPQFQGRVTITATQLRIVGAQLGDAGNFSVEVVPLATTGLTTNTRSIQLRVFDGVSGVALAVPSAAVEGGNVSLTCSWIAGTEIRVQWQKGGVTIVADSRITMSAGSLVISPSRRADAGDYTCTASNPVSAESATRTLTVYYGPDTPVLTVDRPKACVGGGDVLVGQTARLTCTCASLPPAVFTWRRDGQLISGQPDSGVLSLQTFSTNESGRYACTARNSISGATSEQATNLAIVGVCFDGGEVAGIVIGSFLGLVIIILLILLLLFLVRRKRVQQRQRGNVFISTMEPNQNPEPPAPLPEPRRETIPNLGPPLYQTRHSDRLNATRRENNPPSLSANRRQTSSTVLHNGHTNGLLHNAARNTDSVPHNGIDNPAFTIDDAREVNRQPITQQQNPDIVIQAGNAQPGGVQVSFNTLRRAAGHDSNAPIPTINLNLNSFPPNNPQTQQESLFPPNTPQTQHNFSNTRQSNPPEQIRQFIAADPTLSGHVLPNGLIPTGFSHVNSGMAPQQDANTQTYHPGLQRAVMAQDSTSSSTPRQRPWDFRRGTPSYPNHSLQRGHAPPAYTSDYTSNAHTQDNRAPMESQPPRRRTPPRRDPPSDDTRSRSRSAERRRPHTAGVSQLESLHSPERDARTRRHQQDIRRSPGAPRQDIARSNSPQAVPVGSQQAGAGRAAVSAQRGLDADPRALADPNHLQQVQVNLRLVAAPESPDAGMQPTAHAPRQPQQPNTAPVIHNPATSNPTGLTQAALRTHTERAQVFQSRRQQTQAALMSSGQTQVSAARGQRPPTPPPVIPLAEFKALPRDHVQHRQNLPMQQQRPGQPAHHHHHHHHHHHQQQQHAHPGAHRHGPGPTRVHGQPAHMPHHRQQQAHRGRPRR